MNYSDNGLFGFLSRRTLERYTNQEPLLCNNIIGAQFISKSLPHVCFMRTVYVAAADCDACMSLAVLQKAMCQMQILPGPS